MSMFQDLLDGYMKAGSKSQSTDWDLYYSNEPLTSEELAQLRAQFETRVAISYGSSRSGLDFPPHVEPTLDNANALLSNVKLKV